MPGGMIKAQPGGVWPVKSSKRPKETPHSSYMRLTSKILRCCRTGMFADVRIRVTSWALPRMYAWMTGNAPSSSGLSDECDELVDCRFAGRHSVLRRAVGALDHEDIGVGQFGALGRGRRAKFEIAGVEQRLIAVLGQEHGRAQAMPGRIGGQLQAAPVDCLPVRHGQSGARPES